MMRPLVSIDIETTGLNPDTCQVIEIGAVIDNTGPYSSAINAFPKFGCLIKCDLYTGEPYALQLNQGIFRELCRLRTPSYPTLSAEGAVLAFRDFLEENLPDGENNYTPAGKNYASFDKSFLERLPEWEPLVGRMLGHRVLDPGNLYWEPSDGYCLPDTGTCLDRAGLKATDEHRAYGDALDVIKLIRNKRYPI